MGAACGAAGAADDDDPRHDEQPLQQQQQRPRRVKVKVSGLFNLFFQPMAEFITNIIDIIVVFRYKSHMSRSRRVVVVVAVRLDLWAHLGGPSLLLFS